MYTILTAETVAAGGGAFSMIIMLALVFGFMYLLIIRPENKRKRAAEEMRNSLAVGDTIVTIGGMMGRIVEVRSEDVTFETGEDRVRIRVKKWAVSSNSKDAAEEDTSLMN